jgi:YbbR domain-containing protein
VDIVVAALASVSIQRGGLDVDQDVTLIPVDRLGEARSPVDVSPATARIQVQVFSAPSSRTLKVNPVITGTAAAGFEIDTVTVEPQTALVEGDEDALEATASLDTEPLSISGRSETVTFETELALPDGIEQIEQDPIRVTVTFRAVTESRTYIAGLAAIGGPPNAQYAFSSDRVQLVVGGSPPDLDALTAADGPVGTVDVTGLDPGTYDLEVSADLPAGLTLVAAIPSTVSVTISAPDAEAPSSTVTATPTGS